MAVGWNTRISGAGYHLKAAHRALTRAYAGRPGWSGLMLGSSLPLALAFGVASGSARADETQNIRLGRTIYQQRCGMCHALDRNQIGPLHRGVFGRKAGTVAGYAYSQALRNSGITWNEQTLDTWLLDPEHMVPGSKMNADVTDPTRRALLIGYLKSIPAVK